MILFYLILLRINLTSINFYENAYTSIRSNKNAWDTMEGLRRQEAINLQPPIIYPQHPTPASTLGPGTDRSRYTHAIWN